MGSADEVLVTGCSSGGVAAYTWVDYIASKFDTSKVRVYGMPDSGIFLDEKNVVTNSFDYRKTIQNVMSFANVEMDVVNADCSKAYPDQKWKCMFAQYLMQFIKTPLFISQSEYDSWSALNILGIACENHYNQTTCTQKEKAILAQYRTDTMTVVQAALDQKPAWGVWLPACIYDCFCQSNVFTSSNYEVPKLSWNTLETSLLAWKLGK